MAIEGVILEVDFRVQGQHPPIAGPHQRVDFHHGAILPHERIVDVGDQRRGRTHQFGIDLRHPEPLSDAHDLEREQPHRRIDLFADDLLRRPRGHFLDLHAALGGGQHHHGLSAPVHDHG